MQILRSLFITSVLLTIFILNECNNDHYHVHDFQKIRKIDAHVHDNSGDPVFVAMAVKYNFRILSINVDYPDFPDITTQEKIAVKFLRDFPDTFAFASTFSMDGWGKPGWLNKTISHIDSTLNEGAVSVKFWKNIGMTARDRDGRYIMIDNAGFDNLFMYLMRKNVPVICHTGEPKDCWLPFAKMMSKESKEYFSSHPQYYMYIHPDRPSYQDQINARDRLLDKYPDLKFDAAHAASLEWDVDEIAKFLDKYHNAVFDLSGRMDYFQVQSQRNWEKVHEFFCDYSSRIIYGTDIDLEPNADIKNFKYLTLHKWLSDWKYLATNSLLNVRIINGSFRGLDLPKKVINNIYYNNAARLFKTKWKS